MTTASPSQSRALVERLERRAMLADAVAAAIPQPEEYYEPLATGTPTQYQPTAIPFDGPFASELGDAPNPFLDFRLNVSFLHETGARFDNVPGHFAGDGAGGGAGTKWNVMFTPSLPGKWSYAASFRQGDDVAVSLDPADGAPAAFNGATGTLQVAPADPNAPGFLSKGLLCYDGFYPRFANGESFVKAGTNGPENFLGYSGFDNTPGARHTYAAHVQDWRSGDPDWNNGQGKAIIGAINYLSSHGVNSLMALTMNIGGDAKDTWPFAGSINPSGSTSNDNLHYDLSKLAQWETVFSHAQRKGVSLHLIFNEAEGSNKRELDDATLGVERKLFYREMVARFGHHNAVQWNVSEEYDHYRLSLAPQTVAEWAGYIQAVDPYDHPITVHNFDDTDLTFTPFLGDPRFGGTSFQYANGTAGRGDEVEEWRAKSAQAGRPKHISMDELRATTSSNLADQRRDLLWPTLMSGGSHEVYFGAGTDGTELDMNDFRPYDDLWRWSGIALDFLHTLPFQAMQPNDNLLSGESASSSDGDGQVFFKPGEVYAVYLPAASSTGALDLRAEAGRAFETSWFNPRTGATTAGPTVSGGGVVALGAAPSAASEDWVAVFRSTVVNTDPPASPSAPRVVAVTHDSVTLSWNDLSDNEDRFVFESFAADQFQDFAIAPRDATTWTITGLSPIIDYHFRIRSENAHGIGRLKEVIEFTTPETPAAGGDGSVEPPPEEETTWPFAVTRLVLVNADTDADIATLTDGYVIDFDAIGTDNLNIRAEVGGAEASRVQSVRFALDGGSYQTENGAPYALAGNGGSDYYAWTPPTGQHALTATPYDQDGARGAIGGTLTVGFPVTSGAAAARAAGQPSSSASATLTSSSSTRTTLAAADESEPDELDDGGRNDLLDRRDRPRRRANR